MYIDYSGNLAAVAGGLQLALKIVMEILTVESVVVNNKALGVGHLDDIFEPIDIEPLFRDNNKTSNKSSKDKSEDKTYKKPISGTGKEKATDVPSWAKGEKPYVGEAGNDFAKRLLDKKYGKGNYKTGPGSEYNKLKKWGGTEDLNNEVYLLFHSYKYGDENKYEEVKILGIYSLEAYAL